MKHRSRTPEEIHKLLEATATNLGAELKMASGSWCECGHMTRDGGPVLWVSVDGKGRISISHERPRHDDGKGAEPYMGGRWKPAITVGDGRTPEAIAADIERRLLPDAVADLAACREQMKRESAETEGMDKAREMLKGAGVKFDCHGSFEYAGRGPGYVSIRVDAVRSVRFESFSLTAEQAVQVVELLASFPKT